MYFGNKAYMVIKWFVQVVFPAFGVMYVSLADIWDFPNPEGVSATILAICTFLGISLGISAYNYNQSDERFDGRMISDKTPDGDLFRLEVAEDPIKFLDKKELTFKVEPPIKASSD